MREPYAVKVARTVPGRGEGGNALSLFDGDIPESEVCFKDVGPVTIH